MKIQVVITDKIVHTVELNYHRIPNEVITRLEEQYHFAEIRQQSIPAYILLDIPSKMNIENYPLYDAEEFNNDTSDAIWNHYLQCLPDGLS